MPDDWREGKKYLSNKKHHGWVLNNLGTAYWGLGKREQAKECQQHALNIAREINDRRLESQVLGNLGNLSVDNGDLDCHESLQNAIQYFERALTIIRELDGPKKSKTQMRILNDIGCTYDEFGDRDRAMEYLNEALESTKNTGYLRGMAEVLWSLADAYRGKGEYERAIEHYWESIEIFQERKDWLEIERELDNLSEAYGIHGQRELARECNITAGMLSELRDVAYPELAGIKRNQILNELRQRAESFGD